ncbi:MAG TPA: lysophospholipid acyltransferase family protein [Candidatus Lustribacter sp.]|nr:lysophospholipid acyltransferase family protein [Candidatus Lustribacter sp.]
MAEHDESAYAAALSAGQALYPGVDIGRPGRARTYWLSIAALRGLRARWDVHVDGAGNVAPGAGILIGNHVSGLDPLVAVMSSWWRVTAFTKVEVFEGRGAVFFRWMGQIPLRRGDEASTQWAMDMATRTLASGGKVGLYPEGTRSPDPAKLHRLHKRVLIALLHRNPDVPVYAITTTYRRRPWRRVHVQVRLSVRLPVDARTMTADELTSVVRDALLELGGQTYVDIYARDAKRALARGADGSRSPTQSSDQKGSA